MTDVRTIPDIQISPQYDVIIRLLQDIQRDLREVRDAVTKHKHEQRKLELDVEQIKAEYVNVPLACIFYYSKTLYLIPKQLRSRLLPIRLYNCGIREHSDLVYPKNVVLADPPLPRNRLQLWRMTEMQCDEAAAYLGLAKLPLDASEEEKRTQIADYLGVGMFLVSGSEW
ncbi:hypothetical protein HOY82DRAFT_668200 [Tuber indicum]|nr:hypothetical protein HOY82DRAFT_668200 [Tuber indicum]